MPKLESNNEPVSVHRIEFIDTEVIPALVIPEELHRLTINKLQEECRTKVNIIAWTYTVISLVSAAVATWTAVPNLIDRQKHKDNAAAVYRLNQELKAEKSKSARLQKELRTQRQAHDSAKFIQKMTAQAYDELFREVLNCETSSKNPKKCYGKILTVNNKESATRNPKRKKMARY